MQLKLWRTCETQPHLKRDYCQTSVEVSYVIVLEHLLDNGGNSKRVGAHLCVVVFAWFCAGVPALLLGVRDGF